MRESVLAVGTLKIKTDRHEPDLVNLEHDGLKRDELVDHLRLHLVYVRQGEAVNDQTDLLRFFSLDFHQVAVKHNAKRFDYRGGVVLQSAENFIERLDKVVLSMLVQYLLVLVISEANLIVEPIVVHELEELFKVGLGCCALESEDQLMQLESELHRGKTTFKS